MSSVSFADAGTKAKTATRKQKEIQEVIHPSRLSPTGRLKQEAFRLCRSHGTKMDLLDLWIVPTDDHDILAKGLLDINNRWDDFVQNDLLPNYVGWVEKYAMENPSEAADILRLAPTIEEVKKSTRFVFASFSLSDANLRSVNLEEEVEGLWGQVLKEIAGEIKDAHMDESKSFTQASREVLRRIERKCKGLGFLHPRLEEVSTTLDALVRSLPSTGGIKGTEALAVRSVLDALLNPAQFMRRGFGINDEGQMPLVLDSDPAEEAVHVTSIVNDSAEPDSTDSDDDEEVSTLDDILGPVPTHAIAPQEALATTTDFNGW